MEDLEKAVKDYFTANPKAKEIHGTEDGFLFENKYFATQHNATLEEGKEVKTFSNPNKVESNTENTTVELNEEQKELLANGLVKGNYNAVKDLVKFLKLETENLKEDTLISALEAYKLTQAEKE
ncbi:hypothetical protein [Flavobacterium sp. N1994]|uniref:hypothetical protein n=1 Tax=Flavobacterium sp. N1994 TaxID=2986827 RepID=UPI00222352D4|nr:hypothetical protein [Flavobacterium sp. N1994]